jgi:hypothetical protein
MTYFKKNSRLRGVWNSTGGGCGKLGCGKLAASPNEVTALITRLRDRVLDADDPVTYAEFAIIEVDTSGTPFYHYFEVERSGGAEDNPHVMWVAATSPSGLEDREDAFHALYASRHVELTTVRELVRELEQSPSFMLHDDELVDQWGEDYVVYAYHRDSDVVTKINVDVFTDALASAEGAWRALEFNHYAVGWTAYLVVERDTPAAAKAIELLERLVDYPLLDEERYGSCEVCHQAWDTADHETCPSCGEDEGGEDSDED